MYPHHAVSVSPAGCDLLRFSEMQIGTDCVNLFVWKQLD